MAPIALCVLALLLAAANSQTTQALVEFPWWCMRTTANESTGEVWAEMALCRWNNNFHIGAPNASDQTIRSGEGQCLIGGSEGAFFDKCEEGEPLQKWEFVAAEATTEKLAAADGPDSVPGQIVLASADANMDRPRMCLKGDYLEEVEGTRILIVPCDSSFPEFTSWMYTPPPPSNKALLFMPARHAAGEEACVKAGLMGGTPQISDCDDEDLVANWWVVDGDLIRMAAGKFCLKSDGALVAIGECELDDYKIKWSLGKDGSLKLVLRPDLGCITCDEASGYFFMGTCTGDGKQTFASLSAAPATEAVQVA